MINKSNLDRSCIAAGECVTIRKTPSKCPELQIHNDHTIIDLTFVLEIRYLSSKEGLSQLL